LLCPAFYIFLSDIFLFGVLPTGRRLRHVFLQRLMISVSVRRVYSNLPTPFVFIRRADRLFNIEKPLRDLCVFALLQEPRLTQLLFSQRRRGANVPLEARLGLSMRFTNLKLSRHSVISGSNCRFRVA